MLHNMRYTHKTLGDVRVAIKSKLRKDTVDEVEPSFEINMQNCIELD